jgi:hypothetical protein
MTNEKDVSLPAGSGKTLIEAQASRIRDSWQTGARAAWWGIALIVFGLTLASIPILYALLQTPCPSTDCPYQLAAPQIQQLDQLGLSLSFFAGYLTVILSLVPLVYLFVALFLALKRSTGWVGLLGAYTLVLFGGVTFPETTNLILPVYPALVAPILILDYLGNLLFPLFVIVFPNGRINPRWSLALVAAWGVIRLPAYFFPGSALDFNTWLHGFQEPIWAILLGSLILVQFYRYRRIYEPVLRQQTKWVVYGLMVALGIFIAVRMVFFLAPQQTQDAVPAILFSNTIAYSAIALIPISIAIAIFRYRLWEIDLLINRTLVYVPLTGILSGLYAATVSLFQKLFVATTGARSDVAVLLTTFVVAATFTPVRTGLQQVVDRRFKEPVDPLKEIRTLDNQVRSVVEVLDPDLITRRLLATATHAFHATGGAVYLAKNGRMAMAQATPAWTEADRMLSLPLIWKGRQIGQLCLGAREDNREYSARETLALQQAANRVAHIIAGFGIETDE